MTILNNGNVGIGTASPNTFTLQVAGSVGPNASNSYNLGGSGNNWGCLYYNNSTLGSCASDASIKKDITNYSSSLSEVVGLNPVLFRYSTQDESAPLSIGLIAQQVQGVAPEMVGTTTYNGQTVLDVNYSDLTYMTINAIKELNSNFTGFASSTASTTAALSVSVASNTAAVSAMQVQIGAAQIAISAAASSTASFAQSITQGITMSTGTWSIATSTATGTLPIVSISTGTTTVFAVNGAITAQSIEVSTASTSQLCIGGTCFNGQEAAVLASIASSTINSEVSPPSGGVASSATASLQSAITATLNAVEGVAQSGVRELGLAVHASVGVFDSLITQTLTATTVNADIVNASQKLCIGTTCVTEAQLQALLNGQASGGGSNSEATPPSGGVASSTATSTPSVPPSISINGDNPATINVGDTYADLGASVSDTGAGQAGNANLGYKTFVNGTLVSTINLDTSTSTTYSIDYVATDNQGLTATSTRTVNVVAAASQQ